MSRLPALPILCLVIAFFAFSAPCHSQQDSISIITTNRARYAPGDTVIFTATCSGSFPDGYLLVRYRHLGDIVGDDSISTQGQPVITWHWLPPAVDYRGYMAEVVLIEGGSAADRASIGMDVSSRWSRFPRYGFLSSFGSLSTGAMDAVIRNLNRCHINGLQFYDWQYKHHMPLKGTPENPAASWNDIANRTNYFSTVKGYIDLAHSYGMMAMSYNLLYGSYANAYEDGVDPAWSLYHDAAHESRVFFDLPASWASDLYVMDPFNQHWRSYLLTQEKKAFRALPFDGWHVDQLGDQGTVHNASGQQVPLPYAFSAFLHDARDSLRCELVCNAVNQFGQQDIAAGPVSFLYTEVWDPNNSFAQLASILNANIGLSGKGLPSVLAAYVNYGRADNPGFFNTPGVLLADAVIFANGGAHLELGEHMLGKEYFPNGNLQMKPELENAIIRYYDFLTGYENLLRDSLVAYLPQLVSSDVFAGNPNPGKVWCFGRLKGNRRIVHLINLIGVTSLNWRDADGSAVAPTVQAEMPFTFILEKKVARVWLASPDTLEGLPQELAFTQQGDTVAVTIPRLAYWDMIVAECKDGPAGVVQGRVALPIRPQLGQNYPNPFNPTTGVRFQVPGVSDVKITVYDVLGREVATLVNERKPAGTYTVRFDGSGLASGVYIYRLNAGSFVQSRKMILLR